MKKKRKTKKKTVMRMKIKECFGRQFYSKRQGGSERIERRIQDSGRQMKEGQSNSLIHSIIHTDHE